MQTSLRIINPIEYGDWDKLLSSNRNSCFFHSLGWATVLFKTYKYEPIYFTQIDENNKLLTLIPIMVKKNKISGRRAISLPFTDYCELIISDKIQDKKEKAIF